VLTPNVKGFEAAVAAGADEVAVFVAATEAFSRRNINCTILRAWSVPRPFLPRPGRAASASAATSRACSDARTKATSIRARSPRWPARCVALGAYEVSLGDTIGVGTAGRTRALLAAVGERVPVAALAGHFHDTYGQALTNVYASMEMGVGDVRLLGGGAGRLSLR